MFTKYFLQISQLKLTTTLGIQHLTTFAAEETGIQKNEAVYRSQLLSQMQALYHQIVFCAVGCIAGYFHIIRQYYRTLAELVLCYFFSSIVPGL